MSKLKKIQKKYGMLNESYAWEREEGKPLPTLADVQAKYNATPLTERNPDPGTPKLVTKDELQDIDIDGSLREVMKMWKVVVRINRTSGKKDITQLQSVLEKAIQKGTNLYGEIASAYQKIMDTDLDKYDDQSHDDNPSGI